MARPKGRAIFFAPQSCAVLTGQNRMRGIDRQSGSVRVPEVETQAYVAEKPGFPGMETNFG